MSIDHEIVRHVAKLSKLSIGEDEIKKLTKDLGDIVNFVEKIKTVNTTDVEPLSSVLDVTNVKREDKVKECLSPHVLEDLAPRSQSRYIVVPAVIE